MLMPVLFTQAGITFMKQLYFWDTRRGSSARLNHFSHISCCEGKSTVDKKLIIVRERYTRPVFCCIMVLCQVSALWHHCNLIPYNARVNKRGGVGGGAEWENKQSKITKERGRQEKKKRKVHESEEWMMMKPKEQGVRIADSGGEAWYDSTAPCCFSCSGAH